MHSTAPPTTDISAIVLCGGRGLRMGGLDKGLVRLNGLTLVEHVIHRLRPQASQVMLNASRNIEQYQQFCAQVYTDEQDDYAGPLAGFLVGLEHAHHPYLMTLPCDTPFIPLDLGQRLYKALSDSGAEMAMVRSKDPELSPQANAQVALRAQAVICMMKSHLAPKLRQQLNLGLRRAKDWSHEVDTVWVDYDREGDDPRAFSNINTLEDLRALECTSIPEKTLAS